MSEQTNAQPETMPVHPHGYKLADEEMERLESKRESGDVLDPIALNDPIGMSVEKVIGRALLAVVLVLVVGILFAQVACKNIQLWGVANFEQGVTLSSLESAMTKGVSWAGEIVKFPSDAVAVIDEPSGTVTVNVSNTSQRTMAQIAEASQGQAFALAMSVFEDSSMNEVVYRVSAPVDAETGSFDPTASNDSLGLVMTVTWTRGGDGSFSCVMEGYDPSGTKTDSQE